MVEIRRTVDIPSLSEYKEWTMVSEILACGLVGIEIKDNNKIRKDKLDKLDGKF
jgi:hypothetical protein